MTMLETERLTLRPWRMDDAADAQALFTYASSPDVGPAAAGSRIGASRKAPRSSVRC